MLEEEKDDDDDDDDVDDVDDVDWRFKSKMMSAVLNDYISS